MAAKEQIAEQSYIGSAALLFSGASSLYSGVVNQKAAALDARWQETQALYEESVLTDDLLNAMAMAEVANAQTGFLGGKHLATQILDSASEAQRARRALQLRARATAARLAFEGAGRRAAGAQRAGDYFGAAGDMLRKNADRAEDL